MSFLKRFKKTLFSLLGVPDKPKRRRTKKIKSKGGKAMKRTPTAKKNTSEVTPRRRAAARSTDVKSATKRRRVGQKNLKETLKKPTTKPISSRIKEPNRIAVVTHYFPKAKAVALKIEGKEGIGVGDKLVIHSQGSKVKLTVKSLQINRIPVDRGRPGEEVGISLPKEVMPDDPVFKMP